MAAASEVSLNSEIIVEDSDGSTLRNISGITMEKRICIGVRPMASPLRAGPLGTRRSPARNTSREVGAGIDREACATKLDILSSRRPRLRQGEIGEEHQHEDRQVADACVT